MELLKYSSWRGRGARCDSRSAGASGSDTRQRIGLAIRAQPDRVAAQWTQAAGIAFSQLVVERARRVD